MANQLHYRWRYVSLPDGPNPWKKKPGQVLSIEMTEADAERHMKATGEVIEKIPGTESTREWYGHQSPNR